MFQISSLSNEQRRQLIDARQLFEAYEERRRRLSARFAGSMRWVERSGRSYLLHKRARTERSLGPRSPETELTHDRFISGRATLADEMARMEERLAAMAPVNVALGLGRLPRLTARLLRRMSDEGLMGSHLHVVGTTALFAYEALAGVLVGSDLLATQDADLLMDARRSLRLLSGDVRRAGVIGVLRRVDRSFSPRADGDYRAINRDGFYVDLIRPEARDEIGSRLRARIGADDGDLHGSPIAGLGWLVNAPKTAAVVLDEAGYPVRVDTVDPRAFALHKAWIAGLPGRDPLKRQRDRDHAVVAGLVAETHLGLSLEAGELSALPATLRDQASALRARFPAAGFAEAPGETPSWW